MTKIQGPKNERNLPVFAKEAELLPQNIDGIFSDDFEGKRGQKWVMERQIGQ